MRGQFRCRVPESMQKVEVDLEEQRSSGRTSAGAQELEQSAREPAGAAGGRSAEAARAREDDAQGRRRQHGAMQAARMPLMKSVRGMP